VTNAKATRFSINLSFAVHSTNYLSLAVIPEETFGALVTAIKTEGGVFAQSRISLLLSPLPLAAAFTVRVGFLPVDLVAGCFRALLFPFFAVGMA
jgi:hypothetical protein